MARKQQTNKVEIEPVSKKTTIGHGRISTSTMNKSKRRNFKKYKGQGNG